MTELQSASLAEWIGSEIDRLGGITMARFMNLSLYSDPDGYYRSPERKPGRGGDFLTAPEMHPLFGLAVSRQVIECWQRMGSPAELTIREYGSGVGGFAYDVLAGVLSSQPEVRSGLRYEMVEINAYRREQAMRAMIEVGLDDVVTIVEHPESVAISGIVLANEVADALPVHRLIVRDGELRECWVIRDEGGFGWEERDVSASMYDVVGYLTKHGVGVASLEDGSVVEVSPALGDWMAEIASTLTQGYALIIDYGYPVDELLQDHRLHGTLRGYRNHTVNELPLLDPGDQDITAHVDFTRLIGAGESGGMRLEGLTTQADFLERNGLGELLVDMQHQEGMIADVYYRAQAAVYRLIDPGGMGRFRVLGMSRGVEASPLRGFVERGLHL